MMGPHGPLLASGGRGKPGMTEATPGYPNDVKLWVSADGMGVTWQLHSLSYLHNMLMPAGTAPSIQIRSQWPTPSLRPWPPTSPGPEASRCTRTCSLARSRRPRRPI